MGYAIASPSASVTVGYIVASPPASVTVGYIGAIHQPQSSLISPLPAPHPLVTVGDIVASPSVAVTVGYTVSNCNHVTVGYIAVNPQSLSQLVTS